MTILFYRRADREPNTNDRVCSCHFPSGRDDGPSIFQWSKTTTPSRPTSSSSPGDHNYCKVVVDPDQGITEERIQEPEDMVPQDSWLLEGVEMDLDPDLGLTGGVMEDEAVAQDSRPGPSTLSRPPIYPPAGLSDEVIRMETDLPDKAMFRRVVGLVELFESSIVYAAAWTGESITIECQVFMALMKLRQNYTNLHLQQYHSSQCGEDDDPSAPQGPLLQNDGNCAQSAEKQGKYDGFIRPLSQQLQNDH